MKLAHSRRSMIVGMMNDSSLSTLTHAYQLRRDADDYMRILKCVHSCGGRVRAGLEDFLLLFSRSSNRDAVQKAAVDAGSSHAPGWSALAPLQPLQDAFLAISMPLSLLGKIQTRYRSVPLNTSVPAQTSGPGFGWVGQAAAKPVGAGAFQSLTLPPTKTSGIVVMTDELLRLTNDASVATLRNDLARRCAYFLDQQLLDHTVAPVLNISPGAITNAAPSFGSSGSTSANCLTDLKKLFSTFFAANLDASSAIVFMSPSNAAAAAAALNATTFGADGGRLWGVQLETSQACGQHVVMFDPLALAVADGNQIEIMPSKVASIEMDSSATSPVSGSAVMVSLWQSGCTGLRCERLINWRMARNSACVYTVAQWL